MGNRPRSHHIVSGCWLQQPRRPKRRATKGVERARGKKGKVREVSLGNPRARQRPRWPRSQGKKPQRKSRKLPTLKRRKASFRSSESNSDPTLFHSYFAMQCTPIFFNPEPTDLETRSGNGVLQFIFLHVLAAASTLHAHTNEDRSTYIHIHMYTGF